MKLIDRFLNTITMYRLVLYALGILAALALLYSVLGTLTYTPVSLLVSLVVLLLVSYAIDRACAAMWGRGRNPESSLITALILFLILAPPLGLADALWLALAAFASVASKYLISYKGKHLLNPAAVGALTLTLLGSGLATWWVATPALFPAVLVLGLLIVRKLRRFDLWLSFIAVALAARYAVELSGMGTSGSLLSWFVSWPTIFLSTIMLTEPLTMPATKPMRLLYGAIAAAAFAVPFTVMGMHSTPELALVIGNVFTFFVSSKGRTRLSLRAAKRQSSAVVEFSFKPSRPLAYRAGQYAEWTLPHRRPDDRGVRRYFTFSSAPEEDVVRLAVRVGEDMSSFKQHLMSLGRGESLSISNVAGDFTLPEDTGQKLLFVAGGVGITPFISMIRSMLARKEKRDIVLVYLANQPDEFAFGQELHDAAALGVRAVAVPATAMSAWKGRTGAVSREDLTSMVPDAADRIAYISGPDGMVRHYRSVLSGAVRAIKTDYFPGL